jgi:hypothetical protein
MGAPDPKQITRHGHENKKAKKNHLKPIELLFPSSERLFSVFSAQHEKANS